MEQQLLRTCSEQALNQSMNQIVQQVNQLLSRSNSPSLLQQLESSTATTLPAVEQTTPIICTPSAVSVPSSASNDFDTDDNSDSGSFEIISDTELVLQDIQPSQEQINVQIVEKTMQYSKQINQQIIQAQQQQMSNSLPLSQQLKSDTDVNYGGNINLQKDVNSQNAQQSLPQLKLILKQLNLILKQLNSILSTVNTQSTVEQITPTTSQLYMPPAIFAPSSTNNDSNADSYSDTNDNYNGNDLENIDVNSQDAQQLLPQSKLILKQLDSALKQLNSILNPSTQAMIEQITPISSQLCMSPPILAPNVTNNSSNMNPANIDIDFEEAQLKLRKKEYNFICNRLRRLEIKLKKPLQPKNAYVILCTITAKSSNVYPETIELKMPTKSSFIAHVEFNGKHYHGKGLSKSLARQDVAEKVLKDFFFEKMAVKSETCTYSQSNTQAANSSVDKNKEKIDAQNAIVTNAKNAILWRSLANFALYKLILDWNNERTSNPIVGNIGTQNEVCQETVKRLPLYNPTSIPPVQLLSHMQPNLKYVVNRIGKVPHEIFTMTTKINGMEFSGIAASKKDAKIKIAKTALLELYNVNYTITPE